MKRGLCILAASMLLVSCESMKDSPGRMADNIGDNASVTYNKMREYVGIPRNTGPKPKPNTQARFCYRSYEDITCYGEPIPGQEDRLVAWQGSHGQTGYVIEPLHHERSSAPVSLPPLKSLTVAPQPAPEKQDTAKDTDKNKKKLKEIIFDPAELMPKELVPQKSE